MTAWVTPKTWVSGSALTAAELNEQLRDNTLHLKETALSANAAGTWTPGISFGGDAVDVTYSLQTGTYIRYGSQVTCWGRFDLSSKGSSTGVAAITGLPFTVSTDTHGASLEVGYWANFVGVTNLYGWAWNGTTIGLYAYGYIDIGSGLTTVGSIAISEENVSGIAAVRFSITYRI